MADLSSIYTQTASSYQRPEDVNFPVSKIRFFIDVLWQSSTGKQLTDDQKQTLKQIIELLNMLDEHKHESQKELISAMLPAISPLLTKMPTLGLTGTHVFTHLIPLYQLYLPSVERMVKDAHAFTADETLFYYLSTIFDHLFLVHIFEQETDLNMIEMLITIKALILINALVYDYHQHVGGRSISFFTFLMRGGMTQEQLLPFLNDTVNKVKEDAKLTVTNQACLDTLELIATKLVDTTKAQEKTEVSTAEDKATQELNQVMQPTATQQQVDEVFNKATETPVDPSMNQAQPTTTEPTVTPSVDTSTIPTPVAPVNTPPVSESPSESLIVSAPEPVAPIEPAPVIPTETPSPTPTVQPPIEPATPEVTVPEVQPDATPVATPEPEMPAETSQSLPPAPVSPEPVVPPMETPVVGNPLPPETPPVSPVASTPNNSPLAENPSLSTVSSPTSTT